LKWHAQSVVLHQTGMVMQKSWVFAQAEVLPIRRSAFPGLIFYRRSWDTPGPPISRLARGSLD
jgi:hypothetical protein